jgi:Flp pilus assembly protein TadD, contains TPR repeats
MMWIATLVLSLTTPMSGPLAGPQQAPPPPACAGPTFVSWQACADVLDERSPYYPLAMINLGTEAFVRGDRAVALRYYDKAEQSGGQVTSDVVFHAFRADVRRFAGRNDEALADARIAWGYVEGRPAESVSPSDVVTLDDESRAEILGLILPILREGDRTEFARAKAMYATLPARSWEELSVRGTTLAAIGDSAGAVATSARALAMAPQNPGAQNNHCYILFQAGRAAEGLPLCEAAVAAEPEMAPFRHSLAAALAAVGQCNRSREELGQARRLEPMSALYQESIACTPAA